MSAKGHRLSRKERAEGVSAIFTELTKFRRSQAFFLFLRWTWVDCVFLPQHSKLSAGSGSFTIDSLACGAKLAGLKVSQTILQNRSIQAAYEELLPEVPLKCMVETQGGREQQIGKHTANVPLDCTPAQRIICSQQLLFHNSINVKQSSCVRSDIWIVLVPVQWRNQAQPTRSPKVDLHSHTADAIASRTIRIRALAPSVLPAVLRSPRLSLVPKPGQSSGAGTWASFNFTLQAFGNLSVPTDSHQ